MDDDDDDEEEEEEEEEETGKKKEKEKKNMFRLNSPNPPGDVILIRSGLLAPKRSPPEPLANCRQ